MHACTQSARSKSSSDSDALLVRRLLERIRTAHPQLDVRPRDVRLIERIIRRRRAVSANLTTETVVTTRTTNNAGTTPQCYEKTRSR